MTGIDRRIFIQGASTAAAGIWLAGGNQVWSSGPESADLVLRNGHLITLDPAVPEGRGMAVKGSRILAVGPDEEIQAYISASTRQVDLNGQSVTPGLIDAHSHPTGFGHMQLKFVIIRPPEINSFATLKNALARAAKEKAPGEWIVARGFDTFKEGRFPRRQELDEAVPRHPLLIIHWGGQFGVANTLALKQANLLRTDVADPYGGKFLRDRKTGLPDGVLIHYPAIYAVHEPVLSEAEQLECTEWALKELARQGVTCVHDNFCIVRYASAYARLERQGRLACRVRVYPYVSNLEQCKMLIQRFRRFESAKVRLQGIKLAVDGYALMYEIPEQHRSLAIPMHPQPLFEEIVATIHQAGFQADVHAVGDKGVDWTLAAFAKAAGSPAECRRRRHRIEHFPFRKLDSIRRAADLGVPVCIQPNFIEVKAEEFRDKFGARSNELVQTMIPLHTMDREGVPLAYGADVPAFPSHRPADSIRSAMDRITAAGRKLDPEESVTFTEALRHHGPGSAYAAFDENELGSLTPGKQADFVIWNRDLRQVRAGADLTGLAPRATYVGGEAVFTA